MNRSRWIAIGIIIVVSFAAGLTQETHHWWEKVPGFYILFGFAGSVVLIVISRALGKLFIHKNEDYYDVR